MPSATAPVLDSPILTRLSPHRIHRNCSVSQLVDVSLARGESKLAANGALVTYTGARTGRSPKDKFIIQDRKTQDRIQWGKVNQSMEPVRFEALFRRVVEYLADRDVYVQDLFAGADPHYSMPVQIVSEYAWQALFVRQLFLRPSLEQLAAHVPEFTVLVAPEFHAVPERDGTRSSAAILVDFTRKAVLIVGTHYAGEIKKAIFSILNFLLPPRDVFPMHCSANLGENGATALFFGLSGTGKTTLSADPYRRLIGDDEHGWGPNGVFNFEGGCYAKCVNLSREKEPQIFHAIRFGSVLENVVLDPETCEPDYRDVRFTENTRVAYPIDYIQNAVIPGVGTHPKHLLFLTADAFGVLPPISKLTPEQAMYHFLSGYTAKLAGTEAGLGAEPVPDFSTCFGAPFMPLPPRVYAAMLGDRLRQHSAQCWLVNTGWTGGPYGVGQRMNLAHTRAMVHAVLDEQLADVEFVKEPTLGFSIPASYPGVPSEILNPRNMWKDRAAYERQAAVLAAKFQENFTRFQVPPEIRNAGPQALV